VSVFVGINILKLVLNKGEHCVDVEEEQAVVI
jgi:hypothetical protein